MREPWLGKELAETEVRVNCVAPAVIATDPVNQMGPETSDAAVAKIPLGRPGRAEEVAALVAWLASDECSFSAGACFDLSGGRAAYCRPGAGGPRPVEAASADERRRVRDGQSRPLLAELHAGDVSTRSERRDSADVATNATRPAPGRPVDGTSESLIASSVLAQIPTAAATLTRFRPDFRTRRFLSWVSLV